MWWLFVAAINFFVSALYLYDRNLNQAFDHFTIALLSVVILIETKR